MAAVQGDFQIPAFSLKKRKEREVGRCYCCNSSKMPVIGFGLLLPVIKQVLKKIRKQKLCKMNGRKYLI